MTTLFRLSIFEHEQDMVYLPRGINTLFSHLSFGGNCLCCSFSNSKKDEISVSSSLATKLLLPQMEKVHLFFHEETLHIGPLVGIFSAGFTGSLLRPIGGRSLFFAKLLSHVKSTGGSAFLFGTHHINWENGTINGYFYTDKGWIQQLIPFPHVVYDRLPNRRVEQYETFKQVKERLQKEYLIPWFNPGFFNKWSIYQLLQQEQSVQTYLPETRYAPSFDEIRDMIHRHQTVFLKPVNGSLGKGIIQISYDSQENRYDCQYRLGTENMQRTFYQFDTLASHILSDLNLKDYLIQQGISLIRRHERKVDFRVHTNKNECGMWEMTAVAAKLSGRGSVTTHLKNGGIVQTLDELFASASKVKEIMAKLQTASLLISSVLENRMEELIGEIGFDFGIDDRGNVWLFEANSKPGRSIFSHPKLHHEDVRTQQLFLAYAKHLAEKSIQEPEVLYT
ncbi:YheC/YheD family protein [Priestia koreensis]|uniref:YheC/YheD family endospore coat-associated protein n=1 Tax=Priestia koreensis TaxID=284581 RepID=UPI003457820A